MLSRRRFVLTTGLALSSCCWLPSARAAAGIPTLSDAQRRWLLAVLPNYDRRFDPLAKMLVTSPTDEPGHPAAQRTGDGHGTVRSLHYAAALFDTGEKWRLERAREILRVVVPLQDSDPASPTYGCWPWHLEEPLATQPAHDLSSAAFGALPLLMNWIGHRSELGSALEAPAQEAILHAARSILNHPLALENGASTIAGLGVALLAAQEFKDNELRSRARDRLQKVSEQIQRHGSFTEYNSPVHTIVALQELSRMLWLVKDSRDRNQIRVLHDLAWKHAATHFHPPTQQWSGPHSFSVATNLRDYPTTLAFLQTACQGKVDFKITQPIPLSLEAYRIPLQCPRQWLKHYTRLAEARHVVETFVPSHLSRPGALVPVVGTTWLHPRFTLGSVNRGDFGRERRPLLAYWGNATAPRFLRVRFLKDHQDFAAAQLFSVQHEGVVLASVAFASDSLKASNDAGSGSGGKFRARDLRLRFEFGGSTDGLAVKTVAGSKPHLVIQDRDLRWLVRPIDDAFGRERFTWETYSDFKLVNQVDAVAYRGDERTFDWAELGEAFVSFTMEEWAYAGKDLPPADLVSQRANGRLHVRRRAGTKILDLQAPTKPGPSASLNDSFRGLRA